VVSLATNGTRGKVYAEYKEVCAIRPTALFEPLLILARDRVMGSEYLPKARTQVLKQLLKHQEMLSSFVDFASQRVASRQLVAPRSRHGAEALDYARRVLDQLVAHEAFVQNS
jgi:hypothetical protein